MNTNISTPAQGYIVAGTRLREAVAAWQRATMELHHAGLLPLDVAAELADKGWQFITDCGLDDNFIHLPEGTRQPGLPTQPENATIV